MEWVIFISEILGRSIFWLLPASVKNKHRHDESFFSFIGVIALFILVLLFLLAFQFDILSASE